MAHQWDVGESVVCAGEDNPSRQALQVLAPKYDRARDSEAVKHVEREVQVPENTSPGVGPQGLVHSRPLGSILRRALPLLERWGAGHECSYLLDRHIEAEIPVVHRLAGLLF